MIDQIAIAGMLGLSRGGQIGRRTSEDEFYEQHGGSRIIRAVAWLTDIGLKRKGRAVEARPKDTRVKRVDQAACLAGR
jgi:hypothetical protein